jgi:hypothetical protein
MSQLTNRIDKQNIINIAKQQFESEQRSTIPTELVRLPSQGKLYPTTSPLRSGVLEMRYMTAYDEDILTNVSYAREGVLLDRLLESIIVTPGVDIAEIAQCDRDALIIQSRIMSYGPEYPVIVTDPSTKKSLERNVDLRKLKHKPFNLESDDNGEFTYAVSDTVTLKFKFLTTAQIKSISTEHSISDILTMMIRQVNETRKPADIMQYIKYSFLAVDSRKFRGFVEENTPAVDLLVEFEGETGSTFSSVFQVGSDLLWV